LFDCQANEHHDEKKERTMSMNFGRITIYARVVDLDNGTKGFSVAKYSYMNKKCQLPFGQKEGELEGSIYVRLQDEKAAFPPVSGTDPNGECGVESPFMKYDLKDDPIWAAVNKAGDQLNYWKGRLTEILPQQVG
jgi:hypothetical protein